MTVQLHIDFSFLNAYYVLGSMQIQNEGAVMNKTLSFPARNCVLVDETDMTGHKSIWMLSAHVLDKVP